MADVQVKVGEVSLRVEKLSLFCCLFNVEEGRVNFNSFSCFAIFFLCCSWNVLITNVKITEHAKPISQHQLELLACCHRWKKKKKTNRKKYVGGKCDEVFSPVLCFVNGTQLKTSFHKVLCSFNCPAEWRDFSIFHLYFLYHWGKKKSIFFEDQKLVDNIDVHTLGGRCYFFFWEKRQR